MHCWLLNLFEQLVGANVAVIYLENMGRQVGKKVFELARIYFWCHSQLNTFIKFAYVYECSDALAVCSDKLNFVSSLAFLGKNFLSVILPLATYKL